MGPKPSVTLYYIHDPMCSWCWAFRPVLDRSLFIRDLVSVETEVELQRHFQLRRDLQVRSFPSLVLKRGAGYTRVEHDYRDYCGMLMEIRENI